MRGSLIWEFRDEEGAPADKFAGAASHVRSATKNMLHQNSAPSYSWQPLDALRPRPKQAILTVMKFLISVAA
jgi:hypothetical protein